MKHTEDITENFLKEIENLNLTIGEVNDNPDSKITDYPSLRNEMGKSDHVIIGFETFQQCKEFAEKYGLEIVMVSQRDGHHFYHCFGETDRPFTVSDYLDDFGDECGVIDEDLVEDMRDDLTEEEYEALIKEVRNCPDDCQLVWAGSFEGREYMKQELMHYDVDVYNYYIGVLIPYMGNDDEEIEE